jgi:hypothetical protein
VGLSKALRENYCVRVAPSSGTRFAAVRFSYSRGAPKKRGWSTSDRSGREHHKRRGDALE